MSSPRVNMFPSIDMVDQYHDMEEQDHRANFRQRLRNEGIDPVDSLYDILSHMRSGHPIDIVNSSLRKAIDDTMKEATLLKQVQSAMDNELSAYMSHQSFFSSYQLEAGLNPVKLLDHYRRRLLGDATIKIELSKDDV